MSYVIEKNVPIPEGISRSVGECKYPWHGMESGDSFVMPNEPGVKSKRLIDRAYNSANKRGFKIVTRQLDDHSVRVWMVGPKNKTLKNDVLKPAGSLEELYSNKTSNNANKPWPGKVIDFSIMPVGTSQFFPLPEGRTMAAFYWQIHNQAKKANVWIRTAKRSDGITVFYHGLKA